MPEYTFSIDVGFEVGHVSLEVFILNKTIITKSGLIDKFTEDHTCILIDNEFYTDKTATDRVLYLCFILQQ